MTEDDFNDLMDEVDEEFGEDTGYKIDPDDDSTIDMEGIEEDE